MKLRTPIFVMVLVAVAWLYAAPAFARDVVVNYIDANRPAQYSKFDVFAAIQRVLREWEAHNTYSALVFHWGGEVTLSNAPADFNHVVIRWATSGYSNFRGLSCNTLSTCSSSGLPDTPTNHVFMARPASFTPQANNPIWTVGMSTYEDMASILMHEFGHVFRNLDDSHHSPTSVLNNPAVFSSRNLWNSDIYGLDYGRYNGHFQHLQMFAISGSNGSTTLLRQWQPVFRVFSPAALATGNGVGPVGGYAIAYSTRTPAGDNSGGPNALLVKLTDGRSNDVDRVVTGVLGGQQVGYTYHRPCVAVSASGSDFYLVWSSPLEGTSGERQVLTAESHDGSAAVWSAPSAIPGAFTRSGIGCSIDRATERLVVVYSGSGEEGIWFTHRPSLTAGTGQWTMPSRIGFTVSGKASSSFGTPDIAFDYFTPSTPGVISWQDNADLAVHSISFSYVAGFGVYMTGSDFLPTVERENLRSWPVVEVENNLILGTSNFQWPFAGAAVGYYEQRQSLTLTSSPFFNTESYVDATRPSRRYTAAASNRVLVERAFLSTSNSGT